VQTGCETVYAHLPTSPFYQRVPVLPDRCAMLRGEKDGLALGAGGREFEKRTRARQLRRGNVDRRSGEPNEKDSKRKKARVRTHRKKTRQGWEPRSVRRGNCPGKTRRCAAAAPQVGKEN